MHVPPSILARKWESRVWSLQKLLSPTPAAAPPRRPSFPSSCVRAPSSSCHWVEAGARALHIAKPPLVGPLRCSFLAILYQTGWGVENLRLTGGPPPPHFFKSPSPFYRRAPKKATITSAAVRAEKHLVGVVDYCEDGLKPWAGGQSYGWVSPIL